MKSNSQIRQEARSRISGSWLTLALIVLIIVFISGAFSWNQVIESIKHPLAVSTGFQWQSGASWILAFFIITPITWSILMGCMKLFRGESEKITFEDMFHAFKNGRYIKVVVLGFLVRLFTVLWSLLLIIPGIIKAISYSMAPYILLDNPEISVMDAIDESQDMMKGHKMDYFLMMLGELGFVLLSVFTLGIALFWIESYYYMTYTNFYLSLKGEAQQKQPSYLQPEA